MFKSHSSVLRLLTKWAENLESIFKDPEEYVKRRDYPFRNIHNKPVEFTGFEYFFKNGESAQKVEENYNS